MIAEYLADEFDVHRDLGFKSFLQIMSLNSSLEFMVCLLDRIGGRLLWKSRFLRTLQLCTSISIGVNFFTPFFVLSYLDKTYHQGY